MAMWRIPDGDVAAIGIMPQQLQHTQHTRKNTHIKGYQCTIDKLRGYTKGFLSRPYLPSPWLQTSSLQTVRRWICCHLAMVLANECFSSLISSWVWFPHSHPCNPLPWQWPGRTWRLLPCQGWNQANPTTSWEVSQRGEVEEPGWSPTSSQLSGRCQGSQGCI